MRVSYFEFACVFSFVGSVNAAVLNDGDVLRIDSGVESFDAEGAFVNVVSGSWFAFDTASNGRIAGQEKVALREGLSGLVVGMATMAGNSHYGEPYIDDVNEITAPWYFIGYTGFDYLTAPVRGSTDNGLDMSGWTWAWSGTSVPLGNGAWNPSGNLNGLALGPYEDGVAKFSWNGVYGGRYAIDYTARIPVGNASGFGGVGVALHLEGVVQAIPEPSVYGMFLVGLGTLGFMLRGQRGPHTAQ